MARTIEEIKESITGEFTGNGDTRNAYGLDPAKTFEEQFSKVSLESIIFYTVAVAIWGLETLFDIFKSEVDEKISKAIVASVPWYYKIAREYQHGDDMVFDDTTKQYVYPVVNNDKRVVKYAAVRDKGTSVVILASGETGGIPSALSSDVLTAFKRYLNKRKPAGVLISVRSMNPDTVLINATVVINPMLLNPDGSLIDGGSFPVEVAVEGYLRDIVYGGTFNKTKLVDAIQGAAGVEDVILEACRAKTSSASGFVDITGNNYVAESGAFKTVKLKETVKYAVQD